MSMADDIRKTTAKAHDKNAKAERKRKAEEREAFRKEHMQYLKHEAPEDYSKILTEVNRAANHGEDQYNYKMPSVAGADWKAQALVTLFLRDGFNASAKTESFHDEWGFQIDTWIKISWKEKKT